MTNKDAGDVKVRAWATVEPYQGGYTLTLDVPLVFGEALEDWASLAWPTDEQATTMYARWQFPVDICVSHVPEWVAKIPELARALEAAAEETNRAMEKEAAKRGLSPEEIAAKLDTVDGFNEMFDWAWEAGLVVNTDHLEEAAKDEAAVMVEKANRLKGVADEAMGEGGR